VPDAQGESHKGSSLKTLLAAVEQHTGLKVDTNEFATKAAIAINDDLKKNNFTADLALLTLLEELNDHAVPLAVATSSIKVSTMNKLRILGIEDLFQTIITADDVKEHKPHPEAYTTAIERLGATPAKTIIFEDSAAGILAGRAAGAIVIGITKYNANKRPLVGAKLTIDAWDEISYSQLIQLTK
jgi:HAD superfamily hydrolase (TIGR01509 family)